MCVCVCVGDSLQLLSLSLIVANEVSVLTGVDVFMNLQQEPLTELKCLMRDSSINKYNKTHTPNHTGLICVIAIHVTWLTHSHAPVGTAL